MESTSLLTDATFVIGFPKLPQARSKTWPVHVAFLRFPSLLVVLYIVYILDKPLFRTASAHSAQARVSAD